MSIGAAHLLKPSRPAAHSQLGRIPASTAGANTQSEGELRGVQRYVHCCVQRVGMSHQVCFTDLCDADSYWLSLGHVPPCVCSHSTAEQQ